MTCSARKSKKNLTKHGMYDKVRAMKLTKGVISRDEALKLAPDYVKYTEDIIRGPYAAVMKKFETLKRGQAVLTHNDGKWIKAKVTSINHNHFRAVDGPIVRVSNGECSWRVDGSHYAYPI